MCSRLVGAVGCCLCWEKVWAFPRPGGRGRAFALRVEPRSGSRPFGLQSLTRSWGLLRNPHRWASPGGARLCPAQKSDFRARKLKRP